MHEIKPVKQVHKGALARRSFLLGLIASLGGPYRLPFTRESSVFAQQTQEISGNNGDGFRLRELQKRVRGSLQSGAKFDRSVLTLFGLTRIDGFMVDEPNRDCIIFGQIDKRFPPLQLDDFVTALRNVWSSSVDPGCSINPREEDMASLMRILGEGGRATTREQIQGILNRALEVCRRPHKVSVFGIPFTSNFALTMVNADFHMKKVAAGTIAHPAGFKSFHDLSFDWMVAQAKRNCGMALSQPSIMARFWFHPAPPDYEEDKTIFAFKNVGVQLLTEEEHLLTSGQRVQAGRGHPSAETFREDFTNHYREAARKEGVYAELRSCYRLIALGVWLKKRRVFERTGLDLDLWLHAFPQDDVEVPETVSGISTLKQDAITCLGSLGRREGPVWMPTCGGVAVSRSVLGGDSRVVKGTGALERFTHVVDAEPTRGRTLAWRFPRREMKLEQF